MTRLFTFIILLFLVAGCNDATEDAASNRRNGYSDKPQNTEDSLYKEVMRDHDEGMARMGKLSIAIRQLRAEADSLVKAKRDPQAERKILEELEYAEMAMNTWMREFNMDSLKDQADRRLAYLKDEKKKVSRVRENIRNSIRKADSLLNQKE